MSLPPAPDPAAVYDAYAEFYDACAPGHRRDIDIYLSLAAGKRSCLEVGCGTGRVMEALAASGMASLTGVDVSENMLARARARRWGERYPRCETTLLRHDLRAAPLPGGDRFDLAIISWFTINYVLDSDDALRVLRGIGRRLAAGAVIVIEAFFPKPLLEGGDWSEERWLTIDGREVHRLDERRMRDGVVEYRQQTYRRERAGTVRIRSLRRYYSPWEIAELLAGSGFGAAEVLYDLADTEFEPLRPEGNSPRVKFMIKAVKNNAELKVSGWRAMCRA